ncbi:MAG: hypothetical protein SFU91_11470 [Chloroherpetonaceae bacterium]|nr:hypothetical protein [Chloroherpetonaceae bacterium]
MKMTSITKNYLAMLVSGLSIILLSACGESEKQDSDNQMNTDSLTQKHVNMVVALDLSDRISPKKNSEQAVIDKSLINASYQCFLMEVQKKYFILSKDRFRLLFFSQPENAYSSQILLMNDSLNINVESISLSDRRDYVPGFGKVLSRQVDLLYTLAQTSPTYAGADIWSFFAHELQGYTAPKNSNFRNVLIILTDGYLQFENRYSSKRDSRTSMNVAKYRSLKNWKPAFEKDGGLLPAGNFSEWEVIVMEVTPALEANTKELEILTLYWSKWFESMNIKRHKIIFSKELPEQSIAQLVKFIDNQQP